MLGYDAQGKQIKRSFGQNQRLALAFQGEWNLAVGKKDNLSLENLSKIAAYDIKWCLEEMAKVNVPLREAVRFYLSNALPESGFLNWEQAVEKYYEIQESKNLSDSSSSKKHKNYRTYFVPLIKHFKTKSLLSTTWKDIKDYLVIRGRNWSPQTYNYHLNNGRRFWNVLAESKYCTEELNPFEQIPRKKRKVKRGHKKIMHPREVLSFFKYVESLAQEDKTKYQELALMTLTFFCGIRVEEASRCFWKQIKMNHKPQEVDETNWTIQVYADQEKTSLDKQNPVPTNAKYWLSICKKNKLKGRDKIVSDNFVDRMKKLRKSFINEMKEKHHWPVRIPQNTARHTFVSAHLGVYNNYNLTVQRLKHGNVNTLKTHYESTINPKDALSFFDIVPADVYARKQSLEKIDEEAKWNRHGIAGNNQKYIELLINSSKGLFIKLMVKEGVPKIEAEESVYKNVPVRVGEESYIYSEEDVIHSFVSLVDRESFMSKEKPKASDIQKDHLKTYDAEFFRLEDIVF